MRQQRPLSVNLKQAVYVPIERCAKAFAVVLLAAWAAACSGAIAQSADGAFSRSFDVDGPIALDVSTGSGEIVIARGSAGRARVSGRIQVRGSWGRSAAEIDDLIRRFEADPPVEFANGRLRVGDDEDREFWRNVSISYRIEVPAATEVRSRTGSGAQTISGIGGPVEARTGSGSLSLNELGGPVTASTGSGSITADDIAGDFAGRTGSGSVRLTQSGPGDVAVSTGSGSSDLRGIDGALRVRAGSGSVTVEGKPAGPWELQTGSGRILVRLPENAAFDLDAHAGSGGVSTAHPLLMQGSISRRHLAGQVRGGGALLQARTGSGGIRIE